MVKNMGFAGYIGGILLGILAVVLVFFGIAVLLGLIQAIPASLNVPLGIVILIVAAVLLLYGWYSYQSSKPKGTINVHNA